MPSPLSSQTFPPPTNNKSPRGLPISKPPYVTSHIVYQPRSLPPQHLPPPRRGHPYHSHLPAPPHQKRAWSRPVQHPHLPQPRLTTLNTSYLSTTPGLASRSPTPKNMPGCSPTATRPVNTGEARITCPHSPLATSAQTTTSPSPTRKLHPGQARAARAKGKLVSLPPPKKLRVRWPLPLKRGHPPS